MVYNKRNGKCIPCSKYHHRHTLSVQTSGFTRCQKISSVNRSVDKGGRVLIFDTVPNVSNEVKCLLIRLKMPTHITGYSYLCTAVELAVNMMSRFGVKAHILYSETARIYGTTESCVERNIRYCIEEAWSHPDSRTLHDLFRFCGNNRRPTNMEFICRTANMIILTKKR